MHNRQSRPGFIRTLLADIASLIAITVMITGVLVAIESVAQVQILPV